MRQNGQEILGLGGQNSIFCAQHSPTQPWSSYREPRCEGNPGAAFGYCPRSKRSTEEWLRRRSTFVCDWPFFLTPWTHLDTSSTHLRKRVELGCKTRVEPGSRCAYERYTVGWTRVQPTFVVCMWKGVWGAEIQNPLECTQDHSARDFHSARRQLLIFKEMWSRSKYWDVTTLFYAFSDIPKSLEILMEFLTF